MSDTSKNQVESRSFTHFFDKHMVLTAVVASIVLHIGSLGIMHLKNSFFHEAPAPKPAAKVRILYNPNGKPNATQTPKVVEIAKPKPQTKGRAITQQDPKQEAPAEAATNDAPQSFGDDPTGGVVGTGTSNTDGSAGANSAAEPIERVKPDFPPEAALKGIEGWVLLRFDINEEGRVENISIVDASPRGMFDKKAKEAIRKWKYAPRLTNGQPTKVIGREVQIDFKLED